MEKSDEYIKVKFKGKKFIYILNHPKGEKCHISYGSISRMLDDQIYHTCNTDYGSSGSPILSLNSCKVIGIHCGFSTETNVETRKHDNINIGTSIKKCIAEFKEKYFVYIHKNSENNFSLKKNNTFSDCGQLIINEDKNEVNKIKKNKNKDFIPNPFYYLSKNNNAILNLIKSKEKQKVLNHLTIICANNTYNDKIKIFGEDFVENNKDKCSFIINNQEHQLCTYLNKNEVNINSDKFEIQLYEKEIISNMAGMFNYCESLISIPDFSEWDTSNVTDMSFMFRGCLLLSDLPDISKWNTHNVKTMRSMFSYCQSLLYFPDISKWDTSNVTDMSYMFYLCKTLTSLPDISKWNIDKSCFTTKMFNGCNDSIDSIKKFMFIHKDLFTNN